MPRALRKEKQSKRGGKKNKPHLISYWIQCIPFKKEMEKGETQLAYANTSIEYVLSYMKLSHKWDKLLESLKKSQKCWCGEDLGR